VSACVRMMGALVQCGSVISNLNRTDPRQSLGSSVSVEVVRAMREAGAVKALAHALRLISTEHSQVRADDAGMRQKLVGAASTALSCELCGTILKVPAGDKHQG
jgi:ribosomal protein S27E